MLLYFSELHVSQKETKETYFSRYWWQFLWEIQMKIIPSVRNNFFFSFFFAKVSGWKALKDYFNSLLKWARLWSYSWDFTIYKNYYPRDMCEKKSVGGIQKKLIMEDLVAFKVILSILSMLSNRVSWVKTRVRKQNEISKPHKWTESCICFYQLEECGLIIKKQNKKTKQNKTKN